MGGNFGTDLFCFAACRGELGVFDQIQTQRETASVTERQSEAAAAAAQLTGG